MRLMATPSISSLMSEHRIIAQARTRIPLTSKAASRWILWLLALALLLPPLPFGNRLEACELMIYTSFTLFYLKYRPIIDRTHIYTLTLVLSFLAIQVISILLASANGGSLVSYDRGDLSDLRRLLQLAISFLMFKTLSSALINTPKKLRKTITRACLLLFTPAIISTIQFLDIFNLKEPITDIYKTVFLMESRELRLDYRVASVFQDPYTSGIFLGWSTLFCLYIIIKSKSSAPILIITGCIISYISLFYTLRTAILMVPAGIALMMLSALSLDRKVIARSLPYFGIALFGASFLVSTLILNNASSFAWAMEAFSFLTGKSSEIQSFYYTELGNKQTLLFILKNPSTIFLPLHPDITVEDFRSGESIGLFLDSFYFSGLIRYGAYVIIIYFITMFFLIKNGVKTKNHFIIILPILSAIISWKGGNGLLLTKVVIPLGFMIAMSMVIASAPLFSHNMRLPSSRTDTKPVI